MAKNQPSNLTVQADVILARLRSVVAPFAELYYGITSRTLPWDICCAVGAGASAVLLLHFDVFLFRRFGVLKLYPVKPFLYWTYATMIVTSGFWMWAILQTGRRRVLLRHLTEAFNCSGLRNRLGKLPNFIFDRPMDTYTRKLKLSNARLSIDDFKKAKPSLESALQIYVDDIKEQRENGTVEIMYSHFPMPLVCTLKNIQEIGVNKFVIGNTRAQQIKANIEDVPHIMVAGQTSSGKSTFLRQFITSLYLNNKSHEFTLIDLKGGLEFQLFENLDRVSVVANLTDAANKLKIFSQLLEDRMKMLKVNKCKDISQFLKLPKEKRAPLESGKFINLSRRMIVIDEAADIFLAGNHAATGDIQNARRILIEIARKGRAVGLHMVIATQRPDAKSIDSQVKANLPGILCFQMPNDASSMTVLGTGRATDLPPIPGRAIWKSGADQLEVQTPLLSPEEAEELLKNYRKTDPKDNIKPQKVTPSPEVSESFFE